MSQVITYTYITIYALGREAVELRVRLPAGAKYVRFFIWGASCVPTVFPVTELPW